MSNISTSKIASPQLPIGKATATKNSSIAQSSFNNAFNQVKSDNVSKDGSFVLGKNITVTDLISPQEKEMPTFSGQIKMPDGSIANVESVHAKIFTHEQDVELLQQTGMTKAEAEEMLKPIPPQPEEKEQTPQEMKAYLISQKIEAVVRDKEGNIAAKLYKDGSSMSYGNVSLGYENGTSPTEKLSQLEHNPNFKVTHYDGSLNDYDLLPEEMAQGEKEWSKHPNLYDSQTNTEVREFNKRILAV